MYLNFGSKHVFVHLWKNSLWTWLHVYERGSPSSLLASNTVFLVYYPNAEYIFMSTIKAAHKQYILQVKEYNIDKQLSKFNIIITKHLKLSIVQHFSSVPSHLLYFEWSFPAVVIQLYM